jgi:hypothetical protein
MKLIKLLLTIAALGLLTLTANAQSWLTNGLVAYYPFNGNANDTSGFGNNGLVNGAILSASRNGQPLDAYSFNATNFSVIAAPGNSLPTNSQPRTFSLWIKPDPKYPQPAFVTGTFLSYGDYTDGLQAYLNYESISNLVTININVFKNSVVSRWGSWVQNWSFQSWHHIVYSIDGNNTLTTYVDGILITDSTPASPNPGFNIPRSTLNIGTFQGNYFNGGIDDIRIFNRALSATEAQQLYQYESPNCSPYRATATAVVVNGYVVGTTITDGGCGYTNAPLVLIQGGGGSGATATAVISDGHVVGINITNPGSGYTNTNTVKIIIASPPFVPTVSIAFSRVNVTQHVVLGRNYLLESSTNLVDWVPTGPQFTAQSEDIVSEFILNQTGQYFRIHQVP